MVSGTVVNTAAATDSALSEAEACRLELEAVRLRLAEKQRLPLFVFLNRIAACDGLLQGRIMKIFIKLQGMLAIIFGIYYTIAVRVCPEDGILSGLCWYLGKCLGSSVRF